MSTWLSQLSVFRFLEFFFSFLITFYLTPLESVVGREDVSQDGNISGSIRYFHYSYDKFN